MTIPNVPVTRTEQYLNYIATGSGVIPSVPLTRIEQYLNRIATKGGVIPDTPLTRFEQYLNHIATGGGAIPNVPLTRAEQYLNRIATGGGTIPEAPLTRLEQYLYEIAQNSGDDLPSEYQRVEYGVITGTQWIITPFIPKANPVFKTELFIDANIDSFAFAMETGGEPDWTLNPYTTNSTAIAYGRYGSTNNPRVTLSIPKNQWNTVEIGENVYINGNHDYYFPPYDFSANTKRVTLFARGNGSAPFKGRCKDIEILNDGAVGFHGVWCYRKSDDVVGLYDMISKTFLTSDGSGAFGKGADVT